MDLIAIADFAAGNDWSLVYNDGFLMLFFV